MSSPNTVPHVVHITEEEMEKAIREGGLVYNQWCSDNDVEPLFQEDD